MPFDLLTVLGEKSKAALARKIRKKWLEVAPGDRAGMPSVESISNRLGDLENDKPGWWTSEARPGARQAFEQVTGTALTDLPIARDDAIASPDFPELPSFRPNAEEPVVLDAVGLLLPPEPNHRRWIVAPPGAGRTFTVGFHRLMATARAQEATQLAALGDALDADAPLVIGVDEIDDARDHPTFQRLSKHDGGVLVIARAAPPIAWVRGRATWRISKWRSAPGWRKDLVGWALTRARAEASLTDNIAKWLDTVDPTERLFSTPADVLSLCALAHESGPPSFRKDIARRFVEMRVRHEASRNDERSTWLRAWGEEAVQGLINGLLDRPDLPLWGSLSHETWATLLPEHVAPPTPSEGEVDELLALSRVKKNEARERFLRRSGREAIDLLMSARFLRPQRDGLSFHPRWAALAVARERVRREIAEGNVATWGRWAVDTDRSEIVDQELDDLQPAEQDRVGNDAATAFDAESLGTVAALEAAFAEIGRSLDTKTHDAATLSRLAKAQVSLLTTRYAGAPSAFPLTRPQDERNGEWLANCWAFSLNAPKLDVPDELSWLFPGWSEPSMSKLRRLPEWATGEPGWTGGESPDPDAPLARAPRGFQRLVELSFIVVGRLPDAALARDEADEALPGCLIPAIILTAHRRSQPRSLRRKDLERLVGTVWGGSHVVAYARQAIPNDRMAIARTMWSSAVSTTTGALAALDVFARSPPLRDFIGTELPHADFEDALTPSDAQDFSRILDLPARLRSTFARHVTGCAPQSAFLGGHVEQIRLLAAEDVPWLEVVIGASQAPWACEALWRVAPQRALQLTQEVALSDPTASLWYHTAPSGGRGALLQKIEQAPRPLPDWVVLWLRGYLTQARGDADRVYRLLRAD